MKKPAKKVVKKTKPVKKGMKQFHAGVDSAPTLCFIKALFKGDKHGTKNNIQ